MPTAASANAAAANRPTRRSRNRRLASQPPSSSANVENLTGTSGSRSWKMPRAAETIGPAAAALAVSNINDRTRRAIESAGANIGNDANDRERLQIAIHIAEVNHLADGILIWPALAGQRFADDSDVRRINAVLRIEEPSAHERDVQGAEVACTGHAVECQAGIRGILRDAAKLLEIRRRLLAVEEQERPA